MQFEYLLNQFYFNVTYILYYELWLKFRVYKSIMSTVSTFIKHDGHRCRFSVPSNG